MDSDCVTSQSFAFGEQEYKTLYFYLVRGNETLEYFVSLTRACTQLNAYMLRE